MTSEPDCDLFLCNVETGFEVIKLDYSLGLKIKRNDWLLADRFITLRPGFSLVVIQSIL